MSECRPEVARSIGFSREARNTDFYVPLPILSVGLVFFTTLQRPNKIHP
jgi:hypothetical protein